MDLALFGGTPYRKNILQYGKQTISESDKQAVLDVLNENTFLTTGPRVELFENKIKTFVNAEYAVAVNSGTAALHMALNCLNLKSSDEVIVACLSFIASSNAIVYCNAKPIFCDIEENTLNIDPDKIESLITQNTKAVITVDFAGQTCNYDKIKSITNKYNLVLIQDASHSLGTKYLNKMVGNIADLTTFSFHPVKNITTCEGGMVVTHNKNYYEKMKKFRNHGISVDFKQREKIGGHYYDMTELGFNYRIPDLLCALGINQLINLPDWINKRNEIANIYDSHFKQMNKYITLIEQKYDSAYHIYIIKLNLTNLNGTRDEIFKALRAEGLGVNVHYRPIHLNKFYKDNFKTHENMMPIAEKIYKEIITLPIFPTMTDNDINDVVEILKKVINYYKLE